MPQAVRRIDVSVQVPKSRPLDQPARFFEEHPPIVETAATGSGHGNKDRQVYPDGSSKIRGTRVNSEPWDQAGIKVEFVGLNQARHLTMKQS